MNDSFGRRLRTERERRQIPLTSVAENTKINISLLQGLERDDLSRWPVGIYRRSFLRVYAEALGLDPEPLLREFLARFPDPTEQDGDTRGADASCPTEEPVIRLTLAESWYPFTGGLRLVRARKRLAAAAFDLTVLLAVSAGLFVAFGSFWLPLGLSSLLYYVGGIVLLGNTPGVCLFGPARQADDHAPTSEQLDRQLRLVRRA